jgi:hypothetical protein
MKFKSQSEQDATVKIRMVTADNRVPDLIKFILKNNPNDHNKDVVPDIIATHFNQGSKEYIKWVQDQTQEKDVMTKSGDSLTDVVNRVENDTTNAMNLEDANVQMKSEDQSISGLTEVKKALETNKPVNNNIDTNKNEKDSALYEDHDEVLLDAIDAVNFY